MRISLDEVSATTPCPDVLGGRTRHFPRMASGGPVTMPYLASGPLGQHQIVIPSLCASGYLVPPRSNADETTEHVCTECQDRLAAPQGDRTSRRPLTNASASTPT